MLVIDCSSEYEYDSSFNKEKVLTQSENEMWASKDGSNTNEFLTFDFQKTSKFTKIKLAFAGGVNCIPKNFLVKIPSSQTQTGKNCSWKSIATFQNTKTQRDIGENSGKFAEFSLPQPQTTRFVRLFFKDAIGTSNGKFILVSRVVFE